MTIKSSVPHYRVNYVLWKYLIKKYWQLRIACVEYAKVHAKTIMLASLNCADLCQSTIACQYQLKLYLSILKYLQQYCLEIRIFIEILVCFLVRLLWSYFYHHLTKINWLYMFWPIKLVLHRFMPPTWMDSPVKVRYPKKSIPICIYSLW